MALPENQLSSMPVVGAYLSPDDRPYSPLVDYELGGVALNDPSQGLMVKVWQVFMDGNDVMVGPEGGFAEYIFTAPGITELALAFDQNMHATIAFTQNGVVKLRWFDSSVPGFVITDFAGARSPRLCMDDKRAMESNANDIIFGYIRNGSLYYRQQRDRYSIERLLASNVASNGSSGVLEKIGMTDRNRIQFVVR